MASLSTKIKLYAEANSKTIDFNKDVILQDDSDGNGPYIAKWNVTGLAQPTDADLITYDAAATTEETNNTVKHTRKMAYGDIGDQLDEIFKDIDAWKTRIQGIKDANPKG